MSELWYLYNIVMLSLNDQNLLNARSIYIYIYIYKVIHKFCNKIRNAQFLKLPTTFTLATHTR